MMSLRNIPNTMRLRFALCFAAALSASSPAVANEFALSVSPPRFELSSQPGQTVRAVAELTNASGVATQLNFATAEWDLTPDGGVKLSEALKPNSCRPWVAIERKQATLQAKAQLRYRFEVAPPAGTAPTECRFALVVSGAASRVSPNENVSFPISGQIALIVYVTVGEVKPQLRIVEADVANINGVMTPVLMVENRGTAHGRLSAFLSGTDAAGKKREFSPSTLPVLPGETRRIALNVDDAGDAVETQGHAPSSQANAGAIAYPLKITGTINDSVNSFRFEGVFAP